MEGEIGETSAAATARFLGILDERNRGAGEEAEEEAEAARNSGGIAKREESGVPLALTDCKRSKRWAWLRETRNSPARLCAFQEVLQGIWMGNDESLSSLFLDLSNSGTHGAGRSFEAGCMMFIVSGAGAFLLDLEFRREILGGRDGNLDDEMDSSR